jgi:hypothetical protein
MRSFFLFFFLFGFTVFGQTHKPLVEQYRFGNFSSAERLSVDPFGKIYVSDGSQHTVFRYRLDGTMEAKAGGQGWDNNQFDHPCGIDAHSGVIVYVADQKNNRIVRLDRDLNFVGAFTSPENALPQNSFGYPLDVVLSNTENLYILDGENNRIVSTSGFTSVDKFFGGVDAGRGALHSPVAIAMTRDERLYVLEQNRVVVFDTFGNFLFDFGSNIISSGRGIAVQDKNIFIVEPDSIKKFQFDGTVQDLWALKDCFFAEPAMELKDIAIHGAALLLLTSKNIIVMQ